MAFPPVYNVEVLFPSGRKQRVKVHDEVNTLRLVSTAVGAAAIRRLLEEGGREAEEALSFRILTRNRSAPLVGFRWTQSGRVIAESHVPKLGLTRDEFRLHLMCVAHEADRLEQLLTGEDRN